MIEQVLKEINRYFPRTVETLKEVEVDGLIGNFKERYAVGQHVLVKGTIMSDGVYTITAVSPTKLTVDATLTAEVVGDREYSAVFGLAIPAEVLRLAAEIETADSGTGGGVSSETLGKYSVSYAGDGSWQSKYRSALNQWRLPYSDINTFVKTLNWQNRDVGWW